MLTLDEAKKLLVDIVNESPRGKRNAVGFTPFDVETCIYDDGNGNHCIIGEMLARIGAPCPSGQGSNTTAFAWLSGTYVKDGHMDRETAEWLCLVQGRFDWRKDDTDKFRTWRQALVACRRTGVL